MRYGVGSVSGGDYKLAAFQLLGIKVLFLYSPRTYIGSLSDHNPFLYWAPSVSSDQAHFPSTILMLIICLVELIQIIYLLMCIKLYFITLDNW